MIPADMLPEWEQILRQQTDDNVSPRQYEATCDKFFRRVCARIGVNMDDVFDATFRAQMAEFLDANEHSKGAT